MGSILVITLAEIRTMEALLGVLLITFVCMILVAAVGYVLYGKREA